MADTDLSKIVGLIMENPKLIEEIKEIASKSEEKAENPPMAEETAAQDPRIEARATVEDTPQKQRKEGSRARRGELLRALKPYVSSERSKAIESMISITEILDMMRES